MQEGLFCLTRMHSCGATTSRSLAFVCITSYDFFCRGRHRNGENYLFDIKDISDGGCALIDEKPESEVSQRIIQSSKIQLSSSLAEHGEITVLI